MNAVIIVAGGRGLRMGTAVPKQFLPLAGKPVLIHTIERFLAADERLSIVLALPPAEHPRWQALCQEHHFAPARLRVVSGGSTRFHSVRNAIEAVPPEAELIAVHDGVRPLVPTSLIRRCFERAAETGAVLPATPVVETLRHVSHGVVPRGDYRLVQTPQVFRAHILRAAYRQPYDAAFTDDASVVEAAGFPVTLIEGSRRNIKLTAPDDLLLAEALLAATPSDPSPLTEEEAQRACPEDGRQL